MGAKNTPSREKVLSLLLMLALIGWFGSESIHSLLFGEVQKRQQIANSLRKKVSQLEKQSLRVTHANRVLTEIDELEQALPGNHSVAVTLYQNWLIEQTRSCGFEEAMIIPGQPVKETERVYRIPFTIQGSTALTTWGEFLDEFYRVGLLHKVTYLSLSGGSKTGNQQVVLNVECLSFSDLPDRNRLTSPDNNFALQVSTKYQSLSTFFDLHNPFQTASISSGDHFEENQFLPDSYKSSQEEATTKPDKAERHLRLVAALQNGSMRQALFWDMDEEKEILIQEGESLQSVGLSGQLQKIKIDSIILKIQGIDQQLNLGETLSALRPGFKSPLDQFMR